MTVAILPTEREDIASWMGLAEQMVPLFGPMPGFEATLQRKIAQKQAYCARIGAAGRLFAGGVLIGGTGRQHWIRWLAVSPAHRRFGIGRMLVETAISVMPTNSAIFVDSFVDGSTGAEAARCLYEGCGFSPTEVCQAGNFVRQRYVRQPCLSA